MKLKLILSILLVSISNNCLSNNDKNNVVETELCQQRNFDNKIIVDISEQKLYLHCNYANGKQEVKIYPVSTSKYGIGSEANSYKTPLGLHRIENKIGHGAEANTIFKARRNTGRKAIINTPGSGDSITSRIMWLKGLEPGKNSGKGIDSYQRYIYIHGTREENKIGQVASYGCIRMYNKDVIELFDRVDEGTTVEMKP
jgi:lipoprotein-anchoring transpeptidase ErfK/SrfK